MGPPSSAIEKMGDKIESKKIAAAAGVNTIPGFKVPASFLLVNSSGNRFYDWWKMNQYENCRQEMSLFFYPRFGEVATIADLNFG